jgi:hypothetical protein
MKQSAMAIALVLLSSASLLPQQRQQPPKIEDSVIAFYVGEFQRVVNVNPDVFAKALPIIREFIQTRFEISMRRLDTMQQLQMLVNRRDSSDQDIKQAIHDLDKADADNQANQDHFLSSIDPILTTRQQGRVRVFQQVADQRMRQMLNSIRSGRATNSPNQ